MRNAHVIDSNDCHWIVLYEYMLGKVSLLFYAADPASPVDATPNVRLVNKAHELVRLNGYSLRDADKMDRPRSLLSSASVSADPPASDSFF